MVRVRNGVLDMDTRGGWIAIILLIVVGLALIGYTHVYLGKQSSDDMASFVGMAKVIMPSFEHHGSCTARVTKGVTWRDIPTDTRSRLYEGPPRKIVARRHVTKQTPYIRPRNESWRANLGIQVNDLENLQYKIEPPKKHFKDVPPDSSDWNTGISDISSPFK